MHKDIKNRILDSFFSLGALNPRPVETLFEVDLSKRYVGGDRVTIRVPTLSESLNGTFKEVADLMTLGMKK